MLDFYLYVNIFLMSYYEKSMSFIIIIIYFVQVPSSENLSYAKTSRELFLVTFIV